MMVEMLKDACQFCATQLKHDKFILLNLLQNERYSAFANKLLAFLNTVVNEDINSHSNICGICYSDIESFLAFLHRCRCIQPYFRLFCGKKVKEDEFTITIKTIEIEKKIETRQREAESRSSESKKSDSSASINADEIQLEDTDHNDKLLESFTSTNADKIKSNDSVSVESDSGKLSGSQERKLIIPVLQNEISLLNSFVETSSKSLSEEQELHKSSIDDAKSPVSNPLRDNIQMSKTSKGGIKNSQLILKNTKKRHLEELNCDMKKRDSNELDKYIAKRLPNISILKVEPPVDNSFDKSNKSLVSSKLDNKPSKAFSKNNETKPKPATIIPATEFDKNTPKYDIIVLSDSENEDITNNSEKTNLVKLHESKCDIKRAKRSNLNISNRRKIRSTGYFEKTDTKLENSGKVTKSRRNPIFPRNEKLIIYEFYKKYILAKELPPKELSRDCIVENFDTLGLRDENDIHNHVIATYFR